MMFLWILCCVVLNYEFLEALVITNGPMNVTVCSGTNAEISCGFTGVSDPLSTFPNWSWRIVKRNNDGYVISNETVNALDINFDYTDDLAFVIVTRDLNGIISANNSYLLVGPVDDTYNNTSYQCIFAINDTIIESDTAGTVTVIVFTTNTPTTDVTTAGITATDVTTAGITATGAVTTTDVTATGTTTIDITTIDVTITTGPITSSGMTAITLPTDIPTTDPPTIESATCTFICSITSPELIANTLIISCELLETLRRISATIICTNCTCFQPITITGDSPIIVSDLIAGQYTIEMAIADSTEINDTIVEMISVSDNKPINSTVVKMITESNKCTSASTNGPISERSDSLSSGAVATITFAVTFIITLTATAIVTFIVTYICVKKQYESPNNNQLQSPQEKVLYDEVCLPSHTVTKNDLELQPNPAYGTSHKVIMDTNPAYESCK